MKPAEENSSYEEVKRRIEAERRELRERQAERQERVEKLIERTDRVQEKLRRIAAS